MEDVKNVRGSRVLTGIRFMSATAVHRLLSRHFLSIGSQSFLDVYPNPPLFLSHKPRMAKLQMFFRSERLRGDDGQFLHGMDTRHTHKTR